MLQKLIIYVTHASTFDFKKYLYEPLRQSTLNSQHEIILPHENSLKPNTSKEVIKQANLVLAEVSYPSTGQGIELGWADLFKTPIICLFQEDKNYSSSVAIICKEFISYKNSNDLTIKLENYLNDSNR